MATRRTGEEVKDSIVQAVLGLVADRGLTGLTTVAIAKASGIRQPNFYAYFKNVDAALDAAARNVAERFEAMNDTAFEIVKAKILEGEPFLEASIAYHTTLLERVLAERSMTELFLRHHKDDSAFGRAMRSLEGRYLDKVTANLWNVAIKVGLRGEHLAEVRLLAEFHIGAIYVAALSLLEGRATDLPLVATALANNADATSRRTFKRLLAQR